VASGQTLLRSVKIWALAIRPEEELKPLSGVSFCFRFPLSNSESPLLCEKNKILFL